MRIRGTLNTRPAREATPTAAGRGPLEPHRHAADDLGQVADLGDYPLADFLVDLDQGDGVAAGLVAAEIEGGDVDAGVAQQGSQRAWGRT